MGHPVLRQPGRQLEKADFRNPLVQTLIDDMIETMHEYNGVGLAAPQVHASLRLFVALLDEDPDAKTSATVIVNPEIVPNADTREDGWEGCLSIPRIYTDVTRPTSVRVQAWNLKARPFTLSVDGYLSRVIQHEFDHLNGIVFLDRIDQKKRLRLLVEYEAKVEA